MPTAPSPRRPAKRVTKPKAAKVKRYEIASLKWRRDGSARTLFGYYRVDSKDFWGKWFAYGCRRLPWQTYSCLGKHKTKEGARAIAERVYQQQLRRALREVGT